MPVRFLNPTGIISNPPRMHASKVPEPYRHAFLEDHLFSLDKVPHTSPGHDAIQVKCLRFLKSIFVAGFN
jgi:hypothetical protein